MPIFNLKSIKSRQSYKILPKTAFLLTALVLLQGCKTMGVNAQAMGQALMMTNQVVQQNVRQHQAIRNSNTKPILAAPMRQQQNIYMNTQPVSPAYSTNPSQQFLNQGMWSN